LPLQLIISGGTYVPAQILQKKSVHSENFNSVPSVNNTHDHKLTPRQYDVLQQLATGKSNKEIARQLGLTESTVRAHVAAILKSFDVSNRTHAVQFAIQNSWL
jgi:DNA-binding NarL/FixJ family response regulator